MRRTGAAAQQLAVGATLVMLTAMGAASLSGCAGTAQPSQAVRESDGLRAHRSGLRAFAQGRFRLAESAFREALQDAYVRDDSAAVADARYNLAASIAEQDRHEEALDLLRQAIDERQRTGREVGADMLLLEATLHYRAGRSASAAEGAVRVREHPAAAPALRDRAWFLSGLVAAQEAQRSAVAAALAALDGGEPPAGAAASNATAASMAERSELRGRLAALDGKPAAAVEMLTTAAAQHGAGKDYRSTARALAAAGQVASDAGQDVEAARHFLRAGRSAAAQGGVARAMQWLGRARELARQGGDTGTAAQAEDALAALPR